MKVFIVTVLFFENWPSCNNTVPYSVVYNYTINYERFLSLLSLKVDTEGKLCPNSGMALVTILLETGRFIRERGEDEHDPQKYDVEWKYQWFSAKHRPLNGSYGWFAKQFLKEPEPSFSMWKKVLFEVKVWRWKD